MIQTKEELFLAELGINTKEEIELTYGAKIKITDLLKKYETKQLLIHSVSNCKSEPKLGKLETELGKLQKVHGEIVKYFDVHSGCDSFKFKDGAVYRVKLERSFGKATLD